MILQALFLALAKWYEIIAERCYRGEIYESVRFMVEIKVWRYLTRSFNSLRRMDNSIIVTRKRLSSGVSFKCDIIANQETLLQVHAEDGVVIAGRNFAKIG